jgi:hypothetical protein
VGDVSAEASVTITRAAVTVNSCGRYRELMGPLAAAGLLYGAPRGEPTFLGTA